MFNKQIMDYTGDVLLFSDNEYSFGITRFLSQKHVRICYVAYDEIREYAGDNLIPELELIKVHATWFDSKNQALKFFQETDWSTEETLDVTWLAEFVSRAMNILKGK